MKRSPCAIRVEVATLCVAWARAVATPTRAAEAPLITEAPEPLRVLFVGNSFTYYNNSLHAHVRAIVSDREADSAADLRFRAMTISGGKLAEHVLGARGLIAHGASDERSRPWEVVVIQGHSLEAMTDASALAFANAASTLDSWVRAARGRSVLFMTWAYADRPEMIATIDEVYTAVGNRLAALVAPVGLAFAQAKRERPELVLHSDDAIHPTRLGSYLAANVFYATLYGRSPEGTNYLAGLDADVAAFAQRVAWQTVQVYQSR